MTRVKKEVSEDLQLAEEEAIEKLEIIEETPQKKYVVVHDFKDLQDGNIIYIKGDNYPAKANQIVEEDRIKELSSTKNKMGRVLIKEQE